jgi:hypothetical protein
MFKIGDKIVILNCHFSGGSQQPTPIGHLAIIDDKVIDSDKLECGWDWVVTDAGGGTWYLASNEMRLLNSQMDFSFTPAK